MSRHDIYYDFRCFYCFYCLETGYANACREDTTIGVIMFSSPLLGGISGSKSNCIFLSHNRLGYVEQFGSYFRYISSFVFNAGFTILYPVSYKTAIDGKEYLCRFLHHLKDGRCLRLVTYKDFRSVVSSCTGNNTGRWLSLHGSTVFIVCNHWGWCAFYFKSSACILNRA